MVKTKRIKEEKRYFIIVVFYNDLKIQNRLDNHKEMPGMIEMFEVH